MRIGGGGLIDINQLFSDAAQLRNQDSVTDDGLAKIGGLGLAGAASNYAHIQMYNPTASGVVAFIDGMIVSADAATFLVLTSFATELSDSAAWFNTAKLGGTVGVCRMRRENHTAIYGSQIGIMRVPADTSIVIPFVNPIEIPVDQGLCLVSGTVNIGIDVTFIGREI